ncbi:MAG: serine/threonine protein kinase, partial [Myxococcaceae bacterium]|nr:serine/threonine protein kinase [Myxococcaceae bacterium]
MNPDVERFAGTARFKLLGELGRGGMGIVYEAIDHQNGDQHVALKVLRSSEPAALAHFKREYR